MGSVEARSTPCLIKQAVLASTACFYVGWDDLDGTTDGDDPWDFGTNSEYPVLNVDFNANGGTADDVTRQRGDRHSLQAVLASTACFYVG